jgi:uncharacterized membrane protein YphA (DoxX/SURF4 family)
MNSAAKKKLDSAWIGFGLGVIAPLLTLYIFYLTGYGHLTFGEFYRSILLANNVVTPFISLCVISNLLVFFIFIWSNRNFSARGVLFATFIYAGYVVYQKYIR